MTNVYDDYRFITECIENEEHIRSLSEDKRNEFYANFAKRVYDMQKEVNRMEREK